MDSRKTSILWRLIALMLLAALLLTPAAAAAQAQNPVRGDDGGDGTIVTMATLRDVNDLPGASGQVGPDLLVTSFLAPSATVPLRPGMVETFWITAQPIWTASGEHVDSFLQFGPQDWPIDAISAAPANNRGNGLAVGQSHQDPNTGGNTTDYAQAYWGYVATGGNPFNYVNGAGITPPTRSWWSYSNWGVYTAAASGLPTNEVEVWTDFSVPASWSAYLCPGANLGTPDEFIGMSGVSTDPNYMETWLYSSDCSSLSCPVDAYQIPLLACRQPAVSVTKTGTVTGVTGNPGGSGTVTVQYCFVVTNATTPGAGVHLASHQVTDATIGYNSGVVTYALAPGASAPALCTSYTHSVTWPTTGNVCVYNTSGASAIGTTPSGWRETTAGNPGAGFSSGTFTSPAATGGVNLQTCASPLAVTLAEFSAAQQGDAVQVSWETVSELDNAGFNLYRSESAAGPQTLLAYLPSSSPGGTAGAAYSYEDRAGLVPGTTYFYWLEDVATSGATTLHGPVSVDYSAPTAVTLSGVAAIPGPATALPWLWIVAGAGTALGASRLRRRGQAR